MDETSQGNVGRRDTNLQLQGKRIVVVGSANGCGAASVRAFVKEGAGVVGMDIRDSEGEAVVAEANRIGPGKAFYIHCDATVRTEVKQAFASAAATLGGIDALLVPVATIHAAPASPMSAEVHLPPEEITDDLWDHVINNNLRSVFVTNQEIFPYLKANGGGRIINFGSGAAFRPYPSAHYSASKGGVVAWTRSLAHLWGKHGITANVVSPSMIGTRMNSKEIWPPERHELHKSGFPLGARRFPPTDEDLSPTYGDPDTDFGPVIVFLVGDGARFITAQVIPVDGGSTPSR